MSALLLIDSDLWARTRAGARAGRGFRYQDAVCAALTVDAWSGADWYKLIPEGVDDLTLHGSRELRVQIKSRHDPQAHFTTSEICDFLGRAIGDLPTDWRQRPDLHLALVLERQVEGLGPTGWSEGFTKDRGGERLWAGLARLHRDLTSQDAAILLSRCHLIISPDPMEASVSALASASAVATAAHALVVQQLRTLAGQAADANFLAPADDPMALGASDVQRLLDRIGALIDPARHLELTLGVADAADFSTPVAVADFYSGVDVTPGHVGAGLVFERSGPTADVLSALEMRRHALVSGPSGAGKTALAWLAAHHTRHAVRWYRVRRLGEGDVARLIELSRVLDASPERPVGFLVDDVSRQSVAEWDRLLKEVNATTGLLVLGTIREEDLFLLSSGAVPIVRPILDEELAARIWTALKLQSAVVFEHWREPFELSQGLLLEYTHLLTQGRRLADTLTDQVRRRLAESRDDELVILGLVAFASMNGAAVGRDRLRDRLQWSEPRLARTLQRLIDEHAVRQASDGALLGLHEIRSLHLDEALQSLLDRDRAVLLSDVVGAIRTGDLPMFAARTLRRWPELEPSLLAGLAHRLVAADAATWEAVYRGLGLATAERIAARWIVASRAAAVDDRFSAMAFTFALSASDFPDIELLKPFAMARAAFILDVTPDLRQQLLVRLGDDHQPPLLGIDDIQRMVSALLPLFGASVPPPLSLSPEEDLSPAPLDALLDLTWTVREMGLQPAQQVVAAAGGVDQLLDRLFRETAWITRPIQGEDEGLHTIGADVRYVAPDVQADVHADVVTLCQRLLAADPDADLVISNALDASGRPFGFGDFSVATKRIPRRNLTPPARVAWNRTQISAVHRLVGAPNHTQRASQLASAIIEISGRLDEAADLYCRNETANATWRLLGEFRKILTDYVAPPPGEDVQTHGQTSGDMAGDDPAHGFVLGLQRLMTDLTANEPPNPMLMAVQAASLIQEAGKVRVLPLWRMSPLSPDHALVRLGESLQHLRTVLGDASIDRGRRTRVAIRFGSSSRRHSVLPRAASEARDRARADAKAHAQKIEHTLSAAGLPVSVIMKPAAKDDGYHWPAVDYLAFGRHDSLIDWLMTEAIFTAVMTENSELGRLNYAPFIMGAVPPIGWSFSGRIFPVLDHAEWTEFLPVPLLNDVMLDLFASATNALIALSTILSFKDRPPNGAELDAMTLFSDRLTAAFESFTLCLQADTDEIMVDAVGFLTRAWERIAAERQEFEGPSLAAEALGATRGEMTPFLAELVAIRLSLIERALAQSSSQADAFFGSEH